MKRRMYAVAFALLIAFCMLSLTVSAAEVDLVVTPEEDKWSEFENSVPDNVKDMLPQGTFDDAESFSESVAGIIGVEYVASAVLDIFTESIRDAARVFALMLSAIVLSAVLGAIGDSNNGTPLFSAMRFCSVGAVISVMVYTLYGHFDMLEDLFGQISAAVGGMIPLTVSIWAMGGNVSTAAVGDATFYVMLNVCERLYASTVLPVCCSLTVLGVCDSLSDEIKTGRIMNAIKKTYNFVLGAAMTLLLSTMAAQTAIAASADSATARAARMVSGTVIPVLGGGVGETFRTLATGVSYLKSVFGIGGIAIIGLLVIPPAISLLLTRFVLMISAGTAEMLGCGGQARMLECLNEVYGSMLAVVTAVSVMFILSLCIFMQTVVAVM